MGSSTISPSTSTSSSTSDRSVVGPGFLVRIGGLVRLVHPFPTLLDGLATAAIALLAGGDVGAAARLGLAMVGFQAAIGTLNDIGDADTDRHTKPRKPIPGELVGVGTATVVVALGLAVGIGLSAPSGWLTVALGLLGFGLGATYDVRLKRSALSWLPFALGIPLLPVYAWAGATGGVPGFFAVLVPAAVLAGAALAIGNGLADLERDATAGVASIAVRLGRRRAWGLHAVLQVLVGAVAITSLLVARSGGLALATAIVGLAGIGAGVALANAPAPARRERGWELEAIGTAVLGVAWLAGMVQIAA